MGDEAGRNRGIQTVSQLQAFQEEYAQNAIGLMPPNQFEALEIRPETPILPKPSFS